MTLSNRQRRLQRRTHRPAEVVAPAAREPEVQTRAAKAIADHPEMSDSQRLRLWSADKLMKGTRRQKDTGRAVIREIGRELEAAAEAKAVADGVAESVELEKGRDPGAVVVETAWRGEWKDRPDGERVLVEEKVTRCRVKNRDGLKTLYESGTLPRGLYEAGLVYRQAREVEGLAMTSSLNGLGQVGHTFSDPVWAGLQRALRAGVSSRVDIAVAVELRAKPDALVALRRIAGDGWTVLTVAGSSGQARDRCKASLRDALGVVDKTLRQVAEERAAQQALTEAGN